MIGWVLGKLGLSPLAMLGWHIAIAATCSAFGLYLLYSRVSAA